MKLENSPAQTPLSGCENCLFIFLNVICCMLIVFIPCLCGFYSVEPLEAVIITAFGKVIHVEKEPGLHWYWPLFRTTSTMSLKVQTINVNGSSVPDARGSPLNVSAIVTYSVSKPIEARYHVASLYSFVQNQGYDVLRRVCGKFPYRSNDPSEASLLDDASIISKHLRSMLQYRCEIAGITIERMDLMEIAYHAEVAQSLLQIQQAQSKVDARKLIVEGAVSIVQDALHSLEERNI